MVSSMPDADARRTELLLEVETCIAENLRLLKPVTASWQPSDFLPDLTSENWVEPVREFRDAARGLSDELLVVIVGDTITEEALPSYQTALSRFREVADDSGTSDRPWAQWSRGWTAEEKRHGDLLSTYLYLTGRVDMRAVEVTTQHLLRNGFTMNDGGDLVKGVIFTSFQERATKISHGNCGKLAESFGDGCLRKICATIAGDEARHESAYKLFVKKIVEVAPECAVTAFLDVMKNRITMPASLMDNSDEPGLFAGYSLVAERIGVYTASDYADILQHLVEYWNIAELSNLSGKAAQAQEYLCGLPLRYRRAAERRRAKARREPNPSFRWIFGRSV